MPKERLNMRQIKEVLRLKHALNLSQTDISRSTGIPRSTIKDYLIRAQAAKLSWPLPPECDDQQLNEWLFPPHANKSKQDRPAPDWIKIHQELKRKGVTLQLLWEEYKRAQPTGYQYSWFAYLYR